MRYFVSQPGGAGYPAPSDALFFESSSHLRSFINTSKQRINNCLFYTMGDLAGGAKKAGVF
jgi:hypothetical protein